MTEEQLALARRAVACQSWRWMPGMRWCSQTSLGRSYQRLLDHEVDDFPPYYGCLPDLSDPATLGCLLALVREAWGDPSLTAAFDYTGWPSWRVGHSEDGRGTRGIGDTEAEALVAALEAAP